MTFKQELIDKVAEISAGNWGVTAGRVVPELRAISLGNVGKTLSACVLYADLSGSTDIVDRMKPESAAECYKAFLHCASKLITMNDGVIEAYDGDRVMGVFLGARKETRAVIAALQLHRAMTEIVNPQFHRRYMDHQDLRYTVGIDASDLLVCKAGVRGDSDLIWVGAAANYAAKLNSFDGLDHDYPTRVTGRVFASIEPWAKVWVSGGDAWEGPYGKVSPHHHYRCKGSLDVPV